MVTYFPTVCRQEVFFSSHHFYQIKNKKTKSDKDKQMYMSEWKRESPNVTKGEKEMTQGLEGCLPAWQLGKSRLTCCLMEKLRCGNKV